MRSTATAVKDYLASLPDERRVAIEAVRKVILKNLDKGYEEAMMWGMIGYAVPPHGPLWPEGNVRDPKKPLMIAALASQKNNMTVYLLSVFEGDGGVGSKQEREWFQKAWKAAGKKLSMGGCCIHFKTLEHAALDVIGEAVRRTPAKAHVENYLSMLARSGRGPDGKKLKAANAKKGAKPAAAPTKKATRKTAKKKGAPSRPPSPARATARARS